MKGRRCPTTKMVNQPIRHPIKRRPGTPRLPNYNVTVRGELPTDLSARVSAIHARSILQSDSGGSSDPAHQDDPDEQGATDLGVD